MRRRVPYLLLATLMMAGATMAIPICAADAGTETAMGLFVAGRYDEALAAANAILAADPENPEALAVAGSALVRLERLEEAAPFLERARAGAPERAGISYQLGVIALARADEASRKGRDSDVARRYREALDAFDEELRLVPASPLAIEGRAAAATRPGDTKRAIPALEALLGIRPADAGAAATLIEAYAAAGRWDEIVALASRSATSQQNFRAAVLALLERFRYMECDLLFDRLIAESDGLDLHALSAARRGRLDDALDRLERFRAAGASPAALEQVRRLASDLLLVESIEHPSKEKSVTPVEETVYAPAPDVVLPVLRKKVEPAYPNHLRLERREGRVVLHCAVFPDGVPMPVAVLSTNDRRFVRSAIDAVRKWRYEPARQGGEAVLVHYTVSVKYSLR